MEKRIYCEACDASAAVRIGSSSYFAAASDDDNVLRVYDRSRAGVPIARLDVAGFLAQDDEEADGEADLEGAALLGNRIYWIGSHGRSSKGRKRPMRQRFFATAVRETRQGVKLVPAGRPYVDLLDDLRECAALKRFDLGEAAKRTPEEPGGLNIEGLAVGPSGGLLIGFRNPIPDGQALVVSLANPAQVVDGKAKAEIDLAGQLDLGGRGIRAMEYIHATRTYLIVAGACDDRRNFAMYHWAGTTATQPEPLHVEGLDDLNPEELMVSGSDPLGLLVDLFSDDGTSACKAVAVERRTFRGTTLSVELSRPSYLSAL